MMLWKRETVTCMSFMIINVCCGSTVLQKERFPQGMDSCGQRILHSTTSNYYGMAITRNNVIDKRIVGGRVSSDGAWPWQVALMLDDVQVCAGSIIRPNWVLTACHCFTDYRSTKDPTRWKVKLGANPLSSESKEFQQVRGVKNIIVHPKYWGKTVQGVLIQPPDYDVALLELSSPVTYNSFVRPICLPVNGLAFPPGKICYVTGWGSKGWNKPPSEFLQEAPVRLVSRTECNKKKSYDGTVPKTALCAGYKDGGIDACQKDSGGPLACEYEGQWYLVGVISWGKHCAVPNKYGVYADVRVLNSWITGVVQ